MNTGQTVYVLALAGAAAVAGAACGGESAAPPLNAAVGDFGVQVQAKPPRIVVTGPDGTVLLDGLPGGLRVRHADATYEMQFGSFKIEEPGAPAWTEITALTDLRAEGGTVQFGLGDDLGTGVIAPGAMAGELTITITAAGDANRVSYAFGCDAAEHFLGFGGQSFDVDHRGQVVPLWVQEDGITKAEDDFFPGGPWFLVGRRHSTHTPMPMYVASRGYGLTLDTSARAIFAMCAPAPEDPDAVRVEAWEPVLRLHLFAGPTSAPKAAVELMSAHVGRPRLPPAFAFAPWLDALYGSTNVRRVAQQLRDEDIPSSVIWTEDWRGGNDEGTGYTLEEDWEVDRTLYPDFELVADDLHAAGFKFLTYNNTFLTTSAPVYAEAVAAGATIVDAAGAPYLFTGVKFEDASMVDLSSPAAVAWTRQKLRDGLALGADGYMADFAEWLPTDVTLASGADATLQHNLYPVEWARLNKELLDTMYAEDQVERLFFLRAAWPGSQPLVSVVWAGDQQTDFSAGDGMPSVIPIGIGLGVTGFPYYGHDIGGYMSNMTEPTTRELWFRWVTLGALSPVMRTHHGRSARDNWHWESDAASTAHFRRWAKLHMRLFPYLYAMAGEGATRGLPMLRAVALEYPDFEPGWTAADQFLLGDRILVAPVITEGATSRTVQLPPGDWYPLEGGASGAVSGDVQATAALEEIPAYVPAGALLVLLPDTVDTLAPAEAASGAVTLADVADDRELWLWPGGASALTEVGGLAYQWDATGLSGPVTGATWNGGPVTMAAGAVVVVGTGTLVVNGGAATLIVTGGAVDRQLTIRFPAS